MQSWMEFFTKSLYPRGVNRGCHIVFASRKNTHTHARVTAWKRKQTHALTRARTHARHRPPSIARRLVHKVLRRGELDFNTSPVPGSRSQEWITPLPLPAAFHESRNEKIKPARSFPPRSVTRSDRVNIKRARKPSGERKRSKMLFLRVTESLVVLWS